MIDENAKPTAAPEGVTATLTVQDLINIRNIIDVASRRGAFQTNEFSTIGGVYAKLTSFIELASPKENTDASAPTEAKE